MSISEVSLRRRWACILSLDAVGFSRMMARDAMGAVVAIRGCRLIVEQNAAVHGGRIFGAAGDSFMIEFPNVDAAVQCAIAIQKTIGDRTAAPGEGERLSLRAGIDAGDVIDDDGNLYGDAVNIAARLQEACAAGGVLVSQTIEKVARSRFRFQAAGEVSLKNIIAPVAIFEVMDEGGPLGASRGDLAAIDFGRSIPGFEGAPVLAVMPLQNWTGHPEQDLACRGFSEDLINLLSRLRQFTVIDRNTTFSFPPDQPDAVAAARSIGARYLVQGALHMVSGSTHMSISVTDLDTGRTTWSDTRELHANMVVPALEEAARAVTATLDSRIAGAEGARFRGRRESRIGVRGLLWRARWHLDQLTARDAQESLRLLRDAQRLEPENPEVLIQLAHWHWVDAWSMRRPPTHALKVRDLAIAARDSDPTDGRGHLLVGVAEILLRKLDDALSNIRQAVQLNPSLALGYAQLGSCHNLKGQFERAIPQLELSLRLSPNDYYVFYVLGELAISHCMLGDYARAIAYSRKALAARPAYWNARMSEIAALVHTGDLEGAALSFHTLMFRTPKFSLQYIDWLPYEASNVRAFFADAIRQAQTFSATLDRV